MTDPTTPRSTVDRESVFKAIASALGSLAKARGRLLEARTVERLDEIVVELERALDHVSDAQVAANWLSRWTTDQTRAGRSD